MYLFPYLFIYKVHLFLLFGVQHENDEIKIYLN